MAELSYDVAMTSSSGGIFQCRFNIQGEGGKGEQVGGRELMFVDSGACRQGKARGSRLAWGSLPPSRLSLVV